MEWLPGIAGLITACAALITALVAAARFFRDGRDHRYPRKKQR